MFDRLDDTIVAISTAAADGAHGVIRISGPAALAVSGGLFRLRDGAALTATAEQHRYFGRVALDGAAFVLPAEAFVFRAPRSYTRQDVVEIHTSGSRAVLAVLVDLAVRSGARLAVAGEFTARAFYLGGLDLSEVHAVAARIHAGSEAGLRAANEWLAGNASREAARVRTALVDLLALVEADIDFSDEAIDFIDPVTLRQRLAALAGELHALEGASREQIRIDHRARVILAGRPNVGKSSLLNALCGASRALSAPLEGSTRDLLRVTVGLSNDTIDVFDTPGWGVESTENQKNAKIFFDRECRAADLICHLLDLSRPPLDGQVLTELMTIGTPVLWVANKCDAVAADALAQHTRTFREGRSEPFVAVSAVTTEGLDALRTAMAKVLQDESKTIGNQCLAISTAYTAALRDAGAALARAGALSARHAATIDCAEYVACDLREAITALGVLFGEVTSEEVLGQIFRDFCIGK